MKAGKNLILILILFTSSGVHAQKPDTTGWMTRNEEFKDIGVVFGVHQFRNTFFELGISQTKSNGGCVWGSYFYGKSVSAEYNPFQNKWGFTITGWTSLATLLTVGANINSYTDYDKYNLGFKPFIGIGPGNISLTYGYNFQLVNNNIDDINRHTFSLRYHLTLKQRD